MRKTGLFGFIIIASLSCINGLSQSTSPGLLERKISAEELCKWKLLGQGEVSTWGDQTSLKEAEETKGISLLSPTSYGEEVLVKFKVMALTPATVIGTMLSISDEGESMEISIPDDHDGSLGLWFDEKENYFFSFKNAPHNATPYIRKNPKANDQLASAKENHMIAGVYYDIELGRKQGKLFLYIDDVKVLEIIDHTPLDGGHIAFRLRGTAGLRAACLIKDVLIISKVQ